MKLPITIYVPYELRQELEKNSELSWNWRSAKLLFRYVMETSGFETNRLFFDFLFFFFVISGVFTVVSFFGFMVWGLFKIFN